MTSMITVEGDVNAVDTLANITTQGSVSAPSMKVPVGKTKLDKLILSAAVDQAAAGSAVFFVRLGGSAVKFGEQVIVFAAMGITAVQVGSDQAPSALTNFVLDNVDIEVVSDVITVGVEMAGSDLGDGAVVIGMVFK